MRENIVGDDETAVFELGFEGFEVGEVFVLGGVEEEEVEFLVGAWEVLGGVAEDLCYVLCELGLLKVFGGEVVAFFVGFDCGEVATRFFKG